MRLIHSHFSPPDTVCLTKLIFDSIFKTQNTLLLVFVVSLPVISHNEHAPSFMNNG